MIMALGPFLMVLLITTVDSRCQTVDSLISASIAENAFTASSILDENFGPEKAKITTTESWCSQKFDGNITVSPWIQVDLGDTYEIHSIGVAGHARIGPRDDFIVNYYVLYGTVNESLQFVNDPTIGQAKVFPRYKNRFLQTRHLPVPVLGRVVRIMALPGSASRDRVCMKFDVNGCSTAANTTIDASPIYTPSSIINPIRVGTSSSTVIITTSEQDFAVPSSSINEGISEESISPITSTLNVEELMPTTSSSILRIGTVVSFITNVELSTISTLNQVMTTSTVTPNINVIVTSGRESNSLPNSDTEIRAFMSDSSSLVMAVAVSVIVAIIVTMVTLIVVFGLGIVIWNVFKKRRNMKRITQSTTDRNSNHYYEDIVAGTISMRRHNKEITARYPATIVQYDKLGRQDSVLERGRSSAMTKSVSESALYDHLKNDDPLQYDYVSTERIVVNGSRTPSKTSVESVSVKNYKDTIVYTPISETEQEEWIYNESYGQYT